MADIERAREHIREFKEVRYIFGPKVLGAQGPVTAELGKGTALNYDIFSPVLEVLYDSVGKP